MEQSLAARRKRGHLICGSRWALVGAVASAYFAYRVYGDIKAGDSPWDHNWWNVFTWMVWLVLAAGLISETPCRRERLLFGIVFVQFAIGATFSAWDSATFPLVRQASWASFLLWCLTALLSVSALVADRRNGPAA